MIEQQQKIENTYARTDFGKNFDRRATESGEKKNEWIKTEVGKNYDRTAVEISKNRTATEIGENYYRTATQIVKKIRLKCNRNWKRSW